MVSWSFRGIIKNRNSVSLKQFCSQCHSAVGLNVESSKIWVTYACTKTVLLEFLVKLAKLLDVSLTKLYRVVVGFVESKNRFNMLILTNFTNRITLMQDLDIKNLYWTWLSLTATTWQPTDISNLQIKNCCFRPLVKARKIFIHAKIETQNVGTWHE